MTEPLLDIQGVSKYYGSGMQQFAALQDFNLVINSEKPGIIAIAGESGSGKSTLANLILGFTRPDQGSIRFNGQAVDGSNAQAMHGYRRQVQAVFQDPFGVFNPFYRVRHVFDIVFRNFAEDFPRQQRPGQVENALAAVGLRSDDILHKFPHQLSGGQRQRIMMARAYLMRPRLIVADEPVSMVDASLRASILDVMMRLRDEQGIAFVYITHDLATAFQICDHLILLYQGRIMEQGTPAEVIGDPRHPYARLLVSSIPPTIFSPDWIDAPVLQAEETERERSAKGCRFAARCQFSIDRCNKDTPSLAPVIASSPVQQTSMSDSQRLVACHFRDELPHL